MIFKTTLKDINNMAVAIDKISTMTLPNYTGLGVAIDGLTAKQAALVLSTRNLSQAELEEVIIQNDLLKKYSTESLIKAGLLTANSSLLTSEKAVNAENLKNSIIQSALNDEKAKEFIQKQLIVTANGEESASTVLLSKALMDEAVKRGVLSEEKAVEILSTYGIITADVTETASKKGLAKATKELIASKVALSALDVSMIVGVAALVFTIYKCNKAVKEAQDRAQELGNTFRDASSDIENCKSKIDDLYNIINDSKSSIEDVTNARKSLLSVQDELIEKFGTEENVIQNVNEAIKGQTDILDNLTSTKWQEVKNKFNNGGFWNNIANFFEGRNNIERMLDEYGEKTIIFEWVNFANMNKLTDEMVAKLENIGIDVKVCTDNLQKLRDFNSLTESILNTKGATLSITGNAEEIYNKILALQKFADDNSLDGLYDWMESSANYYKNLTDQYKNFYNQYILYEKILTENSDYSAKFKDITDAYTEYQEAFISGDEGKIKEATEKYAETLTEAATTAIANGDSDVATYFENMYPTLKSTVEGWKFNVAFDANTDNLQNVVQSVLNKLKDKDGRSLTAEEILGLGEANEQYQALVSIAHSYNMSIEEMIGLLKERNLVSAMDYQGLVGLFGQENVGKLSSEDLEIAYQIKNVGNMTFEELQAKIEKAKEITNEPITLSGQLTKSEESLDKFQSSIKSATDAYTTLLTGNYSSSELLDSIQAINKAASDMGKSIDWESIATSDHPLQAIQDEIESVSKTYADSVLSGTGIEDSDFGQMLANIVQEAYKSEAALSSLNKQIDSLQSAYNSLTDIVAAYNETGYITFDQLQTLFAMEPQYLSCLIDANGQLAVNRNSMLSLANQRLDDAEAQAVQQAITELGQLALQNEKTAVEENAQAFGNAVNDLAVYNEELTETIGEASVASSVISDLNAAIGGAESQGATDTQIDTVLNNLNTKLQLIKNTRTGLSKSFENIMGGSGSGSSSISEASESIDFFDRRVKVLDNSLSHLKATMDNVAGSFGRNKLIDAELGITEEKFNSYSDALAMYTRKADEALSRLPANIAARVRDGAVALTDFVGDNKDLTEAIKDYDSWADKVSDCKQELAELQKEIRQLELDKFNNIMDDFNNQFDLRGDSKDLISRQIDLLKEAGELIGESFFTAQIDQSRKQLKLLETEKAQLVNQMSSAVGSGRIQKGTDEWLEMVNALSDVDSNILDCKKSIEEFDNSILELHTEVFDRIQKQFSDLDAELSNLIDLSDDFDVSDDKGGWTKEGLAQMGLLAQQYELAQYQVQQYDAEIDELNSQYLAGRYSASEYADRLSELSSSQWDAVKASESAKDAILELNETRVENEITGIGKEIDAYNELTQAQIDALKASKDLHDYEQSIAEKTKSVTDLERRLAAMQNDTSAATVAKRKKLEEQLAEARKDLEEAEYDHSIEAQENALNKQFEDYENARSNEIDALRESLNDKEAILAASFETVRANASLIGQEIATLAAEHGITVSNSLISSWQSGENAIASYGTALSQGTSAFIGSIMGVENEVWNLQAQANTTADTLAWMFSAKADSLVNELETLYLAEENLISVTDALQQSLANALDKGYEISSLKNTLNKGTGNDDKRIGGGGAGGNDTLSFVGLDEAVPHYADGTRSSKGDIIVTDEEGYELKLPKLGSGQYTIANEGTQVLTREQTDNLFEWAKIKPKDPVSVDPKDYIPISMEEYIEYLRATCGNGKSVITPTGSAPFSQLMMSPGEVSEHLWRNAKVSESLINKNVNNNSLNVHYGSMITVNGDVNDTNHFLKQVQSVAQKVAHNEIVDFNKDINDGITYGGNRMTKWTYKKY